MLRELSVQNLALIEDARVELRPGYCAWTGETGAGKTLLLTAIGLVLGDKASADLVRAGCAEARAAAVFDLADDRLREAVAAIVGQEIEDETLILSRCISAQGKSRAQANGMPVTVGTLRALGALLIDVHGQHEGRALLEPDRQRACLDAHAGLSVEINAYRGARDAFDALRRRRLALLESAELRDREKALLRFEHDELTEADPKPGEYDDLGIEAQRLGNLGALRDAASEGYRLLYESERSAQGLLVKVARKLDALASSVPEFADAAADLERIADEARDIAYALRGLGEGWDDDPARLEAVESRLALYRRLSSRFRCTPDELAGRAASIADKLAAIDRDDSDFHALDAPLSASWDALRTSALALSKARCRAAKAFAKAVHSRFKALILGEARLSVDVDSSSLEDFPSMAACPPEHGTDRVELLFTPNPGEPPRPLRKIASGGELSRVTLAIKAALAGVDGVPTLIFDEVDTGVGGRLGAALGKTLADLASHHQVICVTHLPQMASHATHHWVIRKSTDRGRTTTTISALSETDRVAEIAAMLRGDSAVDSTRKEALAMLLEARTPG